MFVAASDQQTGEQFSRVASGNLTVEQYWPGANTTFRYVTARSHQQFRYRYRQADGEILWRNNRTLAFLERDHTREPPLTGEEYPPSLYNTLLNAPNYEQAGEQTVHGHTVTVYRARGTWVTDPNMSVDPFHYRVENVSGVLYVHPVSGRLGYANVSFTYVRAGTWAEYVRKRVSGRTSSFRIEYEYDHTDVTVTPPGWLEGRCNPPRQNTSCP